MERHKLEDFIRPFNYCYGGTHYYLIEEKDVMCDVANVYHETKRVELTKEELQDMICSLNEMSINNKQMCKITHTRPYYSKKLNTTVDKLRKVLE